MKKHASTSQRRTQISRSMFELLPSDLELAVGGQGVISELTVPRLLLATCTALTPTPGSD